MIPQAKYKQGDIVDTPYHGRRKIKFGYFQEAKYPGELSTWMYTLEGLPDCLSYSERYVDLGLFICKNSGLPLQDYQPTYPKQ